MSYREHLVITAGQVEGLGYEGPGARRLSDLLNRLIDDGIHYETRISSDTELGGAYSNLEQLQDAAGRLYTANWYGRLSEFVRNELFQYDDCEDPLVLVSSLSDSIERVARGRVRASQFSSDTWPETQTLRDNIGPFISGFHLVTNEIHQSGESAVDALDYLLSGEVKDAKRERVAVGGPRKMPESGESLPDLALLDMVASACARSELQAREYIAERPLRFGASDEGDVLAHHVPLAGAIRRLAVWRYPTVVERALGLT